MISVQELQKLVPTLSKRRFQSFLCSVLGRKTAQAQKEIGLYDQLRAGVYEFMLAIDISDKQAEMVLERLVKALVELTERLQVANVALPTFSLVFAEQRWVCWTGSFTWYDMWQDDIANELPYPAVLNVHCDVTALYLRQRRTLQA